MQRKMRNKESSFNDGNRIFKRSDRSPTPHYRQGGDYSPSPRVNENANIERHKKFVNARLTQSLNKRRINANRRIFNRRNNFKLADGATCSSGQ